MLLALTAFCISTGLALLAFAMRRHFARVTGSLIDRSQRILLRSVGWTLLAAGFAAAVTRDGPSFGALIWLALLGVLGCVLALILPYRPSLLFRASGAATLAKLGAACARKS